MYKSILRKQSILLCVMVQKEGGEKRDDRRRRRGRVGADVWLRISRGGRAATSPHHFGFCFLLSVLERDGGKGQKRVRDKSS